MRAAGITTYNYSHRQRVLNNNDTTLVRYLKDFPFDNNPLLSFIPDKAEQGNKTDFSNISQNKKPRTDSVNFTNVRIELVRSSLRYNAGPENTRDLCFANILKNEIIDKIRKKGLDQGVRHALKKMKDSLLECEYSRCDAFIQLLEDSVSISDELDLRLHICVLTLTSHWKTNLSVRGSYYSRIEEFVKDHFEDVKAKQILSGLK